MASLHNQSTRCATETSSIIGRVGGTLDAERVRYTSYGESVAFPAADLNGDGSVTTTDQTALLGAFGKSMGTAGYVVEADINRDGSVTTADLTKLLGQFGNTLGRGTLLRRPRLDHRLRRLPPRTRNRLVLCAKSLVRTKRRKMDESGSHRLSRRLKPLQLRDAVTYRDG